MKFKFSSLDWPFSNTALFGGYGNVGKLDEIEMDLEIDTTLSSSESFHFYIISNVNWFLPTLWFHSMW
jgi:hypothetical protein